MFFLEACKLFGAAGLLPAARRDPADGDDLHGGLLQGVPAVVPRHPDDAVVVAELARVLLRVLSTWTDRELQVFTVKQWFPKPLAQDSKREIRCLPGTPKP